MLMDIRFGIGSCPHCRDVVIFNNERQRWTIAQIGTAIASSDRAWAFPGKGILAAVNKCRAKLGHLSLDYRRDYCRLSGLQTILADLPRVASWMPGDPRCGRLHTERGGLHYRHAEPA